MYEACSSCFITFFLPLLFCFPRRKLRSARPSRQSCRARRFTVCCHRSMPLPRILMRRYTSSRISHVCSQTARRRAARRKPMKNTASFLNDVALWAFCGLFHKMHICTKKKRSRKYDYRAFFLGMWCLFRCRRNVCFWGPARAQRSGSRGEEEERRSVTRKPQSSLDWGF